jgi:predicted P-loop ATPase
MVINLEELSTLSDNQLSELKEIITKKNIRLRRPYGRVNETLARRASFPGSTNDKKILTDTTGSRRFLVFDVSKVDYKHNVDVEKVYSQALSLYKNGFKFWFDEEEIQEINLNNEQFRAKSIVEELLLLTYLPTQEDDATVILSATDILTELN